MEILVIDDDANIRLLLRSFLSKLGHEVHEADDGDTGLDVLKREKDIGLVILDMKMKRMHGKETCVLIKALRPGLPVIVSSGNLTDSDEAEMRGMGVKSFLRKPYPLDALKAAVEANT
ncbi:MAG: response regulator [Nitrospiraceae bacterium]|nr:response regulator [Nitrospiraceae bacterium]